MRISAHVTRTALLVAIVLFVHPAHARTTEQLIADLGICYNQCSGSSQSCNKSCCGILICRKGCILSCNDALNGCKSTCDTSILGGDTSGAFFDTGTIARSGHTVDVGGPLFCVDGATAEVDVTLTQRSTGAIATGSARQACDTQATSFAVSAHVLGGVAFDPVSAAQACGTARIRPGAGASFDAFQWCRTITLIPEGVDVEE